LGTEVRTGSAKRTFFEEILEGANMANQSLVREFWEFLKITKRYWLLPILIMLGLLSALIIFIEGSPIAPFIYALF
jgi:hypothetical protein